MIYFFADDHYKVHPGLNIHQHLEKTAEIKFAENDWSIMESQGGLKDCSLLILNMIADTCGNPLPNAEAEKNIKAYCERGGNLLLLHGSSAAFWHWSWWRQIVGLRWVRGNDPDGIPASTHPTRPYKVEVAKTRHPLCAKLQAMDLLADEIYINLEQVGPIWTIMTTDTEEGTFPQVYESRTPWGGRIIGVIPGHAPAVTTHPALIANLNTIIEALQ